MQIQNAEQFVSALRTVYRKSLQIDLILIPETAILQIVEEFDKVWIINNPLIRAEKKIISFRVLLRML